MLLERHIVVGLKSNIAHATAQKLLQDKALAKAHLEYAEKLLTDMNINKMQVKEIITYARMKSRTEVKTIKQMYERYGIKTVVSGHGGSEINLKTILEMLLETASTQEDH